jgi:hypothetical protein
VRYLTGIQVIAAFWEGVTLLHRFVFNILASISDDASENRWQMYFDLRGRHAQNQHVLATQTEN